MILAPNASITKRVLGSDLLFASLALIYAYLTVVSFQKPEILEGAHRASLSAPAPRPERSQIRRPGVLTCAACLPSSPPGFSSGQPDLSALARAFSYPETVAVGWAHFIAQDLLVGRFIWVDGVKNKVWLGTGVSVVTRCRLCLFRGDLCPASELRALPPAASSATSIGSAAASWAFLYV